MVAESDNGNYDKVSSEPLSALLFYYQMIVAFVIRSKFSQSFFLNAKGIRSIMVIQAPDPNCPARIIDFTRYPLYSVELSPRDSTCCRNITHAENRENSGTGI